MTKRTCGRRHHGNLFNLICMVHGKYMGSFKSSEYTILMARWLVRISIFWPGQSRLQYHIRWRWICSTLGWNMVSDVLGSTFTFAKAKEGCASMHSGARLNLLMHCWERGWRLKEIFEDSSQYAHRPSWVGLCDHLHGWKESERRKMVNDSMPRHRQTPWQGMGW